MRDYNREHGNAVQVSFTDNLREIIIEGEEIFVHLKEWMNPEVSYEGKLKPKEKDIKFFPTM